MALITGGGGFGLLSHLLNRRKNKAEVDKLHVDRDVLLVDTAMDLLPVLRQELESLRKDLGSTQSRLRTVDGHIKMLEQHITIITQFNARLRLALKEYAPEHPLLKEEVPELPQV